MWQPAPALLSCDAYPYTVSLQLWIAEFKSLTALAYLNVNRSGIFASF